MIVAEVVHKELWSWPRLCTKSYDHGRGRAQRAMIMAEVVRKELWSWPRWLRSCTRSYDRYQKPSPTVCCLRQYALVIDGDAHDGVICGERVGVRLAYQKAVIQPVLHADLSTKYSHCSLPICMPVCLQNAANTACRSISSPCFMPVCQQNTTSALCRSVSKYNQCSMPVCQQIQPVLYAGLPTEYSQCSMPVCQQIQPVRYAGLSTKYNQCSMPVCQ